MKKGGIIAAIIIIILFSLIFVFLGSIKDGLPQPKFGNIYGFEFDKSQSTKEKTIIIAKLNITNPNDNNFRINIKFENLQCKVFYGNEYIGRLSLNEQSNKVNQKDGLYVQSIDEIRDERVFTWTNENVISSISGGNQKSYYIVFNLTNKNLSNVFYNHTMRNDEHGSFQFELNFSVEIVLPFNYKIPINEEINFNIEKEIETDIIEKLNWMLYNKNISETEVVNYSRAELRAISLYKSHDSNVIQFNLTTRFLRKIFPFFDVYIGDSAYWRTNSSLLNIGLGHELIIYGKPVVVSFMDSFLPIEYKILANDVPIGMGNIKFVERKYKLSNNRRIEVPVDIMAENFGEWMYEHIKNNDSTTINITDIEFKNEKIANFILKYPRDITTLLPQYGKSHEIYSFNLSPSDLIKKVELEDVKIDTSRINQSISILQMLTIIVIFNTIIIIVILFFAFWKKDKYLIFNKK